MKKKFLMLIFVMMLASTIVLGAENITSEFGAIKGTLEDTTVNVFENVINFPEGVTPITNLFFGEGATVEKLIILIGMWIAIFIIVKGAISLIPIFDNDKIESGVSLIVTILMVMTGTVEYMRGMYIDFLFGLKWVDALGPFKIFLSAAIIGAIAYGIYKILEMYNRELDKEKVSKTGEDLGFLRTMGNIMRKNAD